MENVIKSSALLNVIEAEKNNSGADFTLKSIKTGKEYTYNISRSFFNNKWYTHVKVETKYQEYKRLGVYFDGKIFKNGSVVDTPAAKAISFVLAKVQSREFSYLDNKVELMHTGSCIRCGRALTDSESIKRGLGPTCASI